ncbi:MAG: hypothetical protein ACXV2J_02130 [Actinomycetes bacterium]
MSGLRPGRPRPAESTYGAWVGVVRRATAGRWTVALGGTLVIGLLPAAFAALPADDSSRSPAQLLRLARQSARVPHEGYAESTGGLGLPDLPRLGDVASLLGGTTHARVWWLGAGAWRVDRVTPTGESGTYAEHRRLHTWDFETQRAETVLAASPVRLPRVDDLLPPQAARRLMAGVTAADAISALPARRVAGRSAGGVRIVPADAGSTVGRVEMWVDEGSGLPLAVDVYARGAGHPSLSTRFLDVRLRRPDRAALRPKAPRGAQSDTVVVPDLASAIDVFAPFVLPERLGSVERSRDVVTLGGAATYGAGLASFVVLPLRPDLGQDAFHAATDGGGAPLPVAGGRAVLVSTPLLNAVVARSAAALGTPVGRSRSYLIAGTVVPETLTTAVEALFADPPPQR